MDSIHSLSDRHSGCAEEITRRKIANKRTIIFSDTHNNIQVSIRDLKCILNELKPAWKQGLESHKGNGKADKLATHLASQSLMGAELFCGLALRKRTEEMVENHTRTYTG